MPPPSPSDPASAEAWSFWKPHSGGTGRGSKQRGVRIGTNPYKHSVYYTATLPRNIRNASVQIQESSGPCVSGQRHCDKNKLMRHSGCWDKKKPWSAFRDSRNSTSVTVLPSFGASGAGREQPQTTHGAARRGGGGGGRDAHLLLAFFIFSSFHFFIDHEYGESTEGASPGLAEYG